jgi:hypothetical protein
MKRAFTIILTLTLLIDLLFGTDTAKSAGHISLAEASLDSKLMYILVTASLMGVIKLKRNAG